ncbi:UDP-N-acetylmuramate dehydrogenase [Endozoicomonas sp. GU-1]|uniref:UDP-N-acetylmuramate dehydrogenase n=1 Tax=Endozoicomonas sp. GU-1 TaxID=3009078 RepID=UPI0022B58157|nr:UDP-N-acetylmuramate dehydrogenase [Endozoicomonas sp. GU-1]WBA83345.1 UDP-N-acetylmuramate dehydrogenase [Endozoicomonas sp. GU-1]WBA86276.1 UDP-N-acetylmuramate dehydrogenase [Endozoicomonas sp. GU-1]
MNFPVKICDNYSLVERNTLGLPSTARYYAEANTVAELQSALAFAREKQLPVIPLGGGSNVVLGDFLDALVVHVNLKGKTVLSRDQDCVRVRAEAGENWHEFVLWSLDNQAYGLENLSLIPGNVGAAPIQNIGAYGVELTDSFVSLEAMNLESGQVEYFDRQSCRFGYRDSVFKREKRDQYIIIAVTLDLDATLKPNLGYGQLGDLLARRLGDQAPSAMDISRAVCDIRREKLPDPSEVGNAGSFFKNPEVSPSEMDRLKQEYPNIVAYPLGQKWKLAAGWLIDQAGLKGVREGCVGTYQKQALVLVNHGGATGRDVLSFSRQVQQKVNEKFGVQLEREPRLYMDDDRTPL